MALILKRWVLSRVVLTVTFLTAIIISADCFAQGGDAVLQQGLALLDEGRTTLADATLLQAQEYFNKLTREHPDNATFLYELARVQSYRCEAYSSRGDKKNAEKALDAAIATVQQSLKVNEKAADAHSLLADLYGRKISFGMAMFAGPKFGPKSQAENKRAQEIDPTNARVLASLGRQYLNAPKVFGGDVDKAIESFRKSTEADPRFDETFVWLSIALRKKGDTAGADRALQEALRLNPRSVFAKGNAGSR